MHLGIVSTLIRARLTTVTSMVATEGAATIRARFNITTTTLANGETRDYATYASISGPSGDTYAFTYEGQGNTITITAQSYLPGASPMTMTVFQEAKPGAPTYITQTTTPGTTDTENVISPAPGDIIRVQLMGTTNTAYKLTLANAFAGQNGGGPPFVSTEQDARATLNP
ncbi:MAG: hypothetical protein ACYDDF_15370 [Thermoplasmatota archaeon]